MPVVFKESTIKIHTPISLYVFTVRAVYATQYRLIFVWSSAIDNLIESDLTSFSVYPLTHTWTCNEVIHAPIHKEPHADTDTYTHHTHTLPSMIINDSSVWEAAPETIPRTGGSQSSTISSRRWPTRISQLGVTRTAWTPEDARD